MSWSEVPFDSIIADSAFGPRFSGDCYADDGNVATLRTTDLSPDGFISLDTMPHAQIDADKFSSHFLQVGDLVISRSGRIGTTALFEGYHKPVLPGAFLIRFRLDRSKAHPLFFRLFFNSGEGQERLLSVAQGAAQQNINITNVRKLSVPLPLLAVQFRVSTVLAAYDDLIVTNQRRIVLLEDAARRLYREWFVHLRFPGHEQVAVKDGVPQGWRRTTFDDVCEAVGGGTPSTARPDFWNGDVVWVTPTDVTRNDCLALLDSEKKITEAGLNGSSAKLVPPNTILMTSRASIGFFALMDVPACTNQGFISVLPKFENSRMYLLENLMSRVEEMLGLATGSTFKELSKSKFRAMPVLWPAESVLADFEARTWPLIEQVRLIKRQNRSLAQARDLLLPKLMSGQIDVPGIALP